MTSACPFRGIVGIEDVTVHAFDKKIILKMDSYIPVPLEAERTAGDQRSVAKLLPFILSTQGWSLSQ